MRLVLIRIGIAALLLAGIFIFGYFTGRQHGREAVLKAAVAAYKTREKINHETENLDPIALCRALGGVREQCATLMRGLDAPAVN